MEDFGFAAQSAHKKAPRLSDGRFLF